MNSAKRQGEGERRPIYLGPGAALARIFLLWSQTAKPGGTMHRMQNHPVGVAFLLVCSLLAAVALGVLIGFIKAELIVVRGTEHGTLQSLPC